MSTLSMFKDTTDKFLKAKGKIHPRKVYLRHQALLQTRDQFVRFIPWPALIESIEKDITQFEQLYVNELKGKV